MKMSLIVTVVVILFAIMVGSNSLYAIKESERGIKTQFGRIINADLQPGLGFKLPVLHEIQRFDARTLVLDMESQGYVTQYEGAPIIVTVDSYVMWRIKDVETYYTATTGNVFEAQRLLESRVNSGLRDKFGERTLPEVVSGKRAELAQQLTAEVSALSEQDMGVEVLDIRVKKVELPPSVSESVFDNMRAEREREAREYRFNGEKQAIGIRAEADYSVEVTLAEAYKTAEKIRGEGDAKSAAIYAKAFGEDPEFYRFTRSMLAYQNAFKSKQDMLLLSPETDFFRYLNRVKPE